MVSVVRVPDLVDMPTEARGVLVRCSPKKDPKGGPGALIFTVDLSFSILEREDAEIVEKYCRGTLPMWMAGQEGGKGSVKDQSDYGMVKLTFYKPDSEICAGFADIIFSSVAVKGESANLLIRFKINGLHEKSWSSMIGLLDQEIKVRLEGRQTSFDFNADDDDSGTHNGSKAETIKITQVEESGADSYGIISSFSDNDGHKLLLCEIDGSTRVLDHECFEVKSTMEVEINESTVQIYAMRCKSHGFSPAWVDICYAVASLYKSGSIQINKNNSWTIDEKIIDRAVDIGNGRKEMEIIE